MLTQVRGKDSHPADDLSSGKNYYCGRTGIRTQGTISGTHALQACAFDRSAILPYILLYLLEAKASKPWAKAR